jgi:indolepyruvate ferredoxin oxidoreductase
LAKKYVELVRKMYRRDSIEHGFAATREAIWGIAKVMLIKDEIYVSYLLTRYEKKQRDIAKYAIDVANGDRILYRHHTRPEFNLGKRRIRLNITTRDWMLNLVRRAKFLRRLPGWHRRESAFREWYISLLDRVDLSRDYQRSVEILRCTADVSGYREVRYPKMDRVRALVEEQLRDGSQIETSVRQGVLNGFRATVRV